MTSPHESILRTVNSNGKYSILSFACHERTQQNWSTLPHHFYLAQGKDVKPWCNKYAILPNNHTILPNVENYDYSRLGLNIAFSQNHFGNYQIARPLAEKLNIPLINLTHVLPPPMKYNQKYLDMVKNMRAGLNLFITEYSCKEWGWDLKDPSVRILRHGINTELFKPNEKIEKKPHCLTVVNDFVNRGWAVGYEEWKRVTKGFNCKLLGDNPGLSKNCENPEELANEYNEALFTVSTTTVSPLPTVVLESLSCGTPVICLKNCALSEAVIDGYNGYISESIDELRERVDFLFKNLDEVKRLSINARKIIVEKFNLKTHLDTLSSCFNEVVGRGFYL